MAFILLGCISTAGAQKGLLKEIPGWFQSAIQLAGEKRYEEAILKLDRVTQVDPKHTKAYFNKAILKLKLGNPQSALRELDILTGIDPEFTGLNLLKGMAYLEVPDYTNAEMAFSKVTATEKENYEPFYYHGIVLALQGDWKCAKDKFERCIELNPSYSRAYNELGSVWWNIGQTDSALAYYLKAAALKPYDGQYAGNTGLAMIMEGEAGKALEYLEIADKSDSALYVYKNDLGVAYYLEEMYDKAETVLQEAIEIEASNPIAWINLGNTYIKSNRYKDAVKILEKATELSPFNGYAWLNMGIAYDRDLNFEKACECFHKASAFGAENAEMYYRNQCGTNAFNLKSSQK